ncbi:MAG: hypothetical protein AAGF11_19635 [Myxococcota bacterium]
MNHLFPTPSSSKQVTEAELAPHRHRLAEDPTDHESLRALFDLYQRSDQVDRACGVAEALTILRKVSPGQCLFLGQHRPRSLPVARQTLDTSLLRSHVAHPDQDPHITGILELVAPAVAAWRAAKIPRSLRDSEPIDFLTEPSDVARMIKYAWRVLGVARPQVYVLPKGQGDYMLLNLHRGRHDRHDEGIQPSMVIFERLLERRPERELAYVVGRAMADLHVSHYALVATDRRPELLEQIVKACLFAMGIPVQGDHGALGRVAKEIFARMLPATRACLGHVVKRFAEAGAVVDMERWCRATELTASRVGLLLAGDLRIAADALAQEPSPLCCATMLSARERLEDLLRYGISEDYFRMREILGTDALIRLGGSW